MKLKVDSETGRLMKVLVHRPGEEIEHLTPDYLTRLLFDDIPFLKGAQREHDAFVKAMTDHGTKVVYLRDLMAETLDIDESIKDSFIRDFINESGPEAISYRNELFAFFKSFASTKELVDYSMAGITDHEFVPAEKHFLVKLTQSKARFILDPIPNLYFTRDPIAVIGSGVSLNRMYSETRSRETIYGRYILKHHPNFGPEIPLYYNTDLPFYIEGGDVLNLSSKVIAVGLSQRTSPEAVELLASNIFASGSPIERILAFDIPNLRAFMHLDTVFTQADVEKFIIHPAILSSLRVYCLERSAHGSVKARFVSGSLAKILESSLGLDEVKLIRCGGDNNSVASEREQWNDASNVLCISPGTVIVYDRNNITNETLVQNGLRIIEIPSSELSRGRGGPRCMSMPLYRA